METLPEAGTEWSEEDQKEWLDAAQANFRLIYKRPKRTTSASEPPQLS
jgi:hypothetical protein